MASNRTKRRRANRTQTTQARTVVKVVNATSFDSARYTKENRVHWSRVDAKSIDASLDSETRRRQRERARYEIANNSYAYGAAMTIANAVIGNGARLQLAFDDKSDKSKELASRIEYDFAEWSERVRLGEKLRAMRFARFQDGESFAVLYDNKRYDQNEVRLDLACIDAERVCGEYRSTTPNNVDGIKLDDWGNPISYRVLTRHPGDSFTSPYFEEATEYNADNVLHWYRRSLPEQHRGCSEISPALELFSYLGRYTKAVVTAAESAADLAMVFYTDAVGDDGGYDVDDYEGESDSTPKGDNPFAEIPFSRGMTVTAPYGMKPAQIKAEQPTTTYSMLVDELLGEIGASLGLPRLLMKHSAAGYNYASGRLDFQEYYRFIRLNQQSCATSVMNPLFKKWLKEWQLVNGIVLPFRPQVQWYWDGFEHVDPLKEANAQSVRLTSLTSNLAIEYGKQGRDWEEELTQLFKEKAKIKQLEEEYGVTLDEVTGQQTGNVDEE